GGEVAGECCTGGCRRRLGEPRGAGGGEGPRVVPDHLSEELLKLGRQLREVAKGRDSDEERLELTSRGDRLSAIARAVQEWLGQQLDGQVYWVELRQGRVPRGTLASRPIDVGP